MLSLVKQGVCVKATTEVCETCLQQVHKPCIVGAILSTAYGCVCDGVAPMAQTSHGGLKAIIHHI